MRTRRTKYERATGADTAKVVFIRAFDGFGLTAAEAHSA